MRTSELGVRGAYAFTPTVFPDERGLFVAPYQRPAYTHAVGGPLFPVAQTGHSRSRRGVVRGVHYTRTPPGMATYVHCARGSALDLVVDLRVGSPTFGRWDCLVLDAETFRAVHLPVGVGHAFQALEDDTVMEYLLSGGYAADDEKVVSVTDPALALPLRDDLPRLLSPRDQTAPTLAAARRAGLLPDYDTCLRLDARLREAALAGVGAREGERHG
ncbi:dTDP-4-dehydrorhamnose 3,5-epimerase family protein [Streptomyces alboflavus]|uniref:dTDP-4-dehydrorhamnose 3,5-epimerase family protein n=1 Tax=Streptomyces alboflavus TaxID=67267 RepID=UPI00068987A9|nr:dTDP-4-dehydrorhamnose 3,5-epimerase [Streptomyces alboflavus]